MKKPVVQNSAPLEEEDKGKAREIAAKKAGVSHDTLQKKEENHMKKRKISSVMSKSFGDDIKLKHEIEDKLNKTEDLQEYEKLILEYHRVCSLIKQSKALTKESLRMNL